YEVGSASLNLRYVRHPVEMIDVEGEFVNLALVYLAEIYPSGIACNFEFYKLFGPVVQRCENGVSDDFHSIQGQFREIVNEDEQMPDADSSKESLELKHI